MKKLVVMSVLAALTACYDLQGKDSGDTSSWGGCCLVGCSDGSSSQVVADSSWECDDIAFAQCEANGLGLDYAEFDSGCVDCEGCR